MNIYRLVLQMGQKVPSAIKKRVISAWLEAKPRNIIADELEISYGSVSNMIVQAKRESIKDMDLLRTVAVLLKKNNLDLTRFASSIRLKNRLNGLKLTEIQADSFLENMAIHALRNKLIQKNFYFKYTKYALLLNI